jgi:hypothetical protein
MISFSDGLIFTRAGTASKGSKRGDTLPLLPGPHVRRSHRVKFFAPLLHADLWEHALRTPRAYGFSLFQLSIFHYQFVF